MGVEVLAGPWDIAGDAGMAFELCRKIRIYWRSRSGLMKPNVSIDLVSMRCCNPYVDRNRILGGHNLGMLFKVPVRSELENEN
jgi:hypothetical protein